jgi:hypothetical protein
MQIRRVCRSLAQQANPKDSPQPGAASESEGFAAASRSKRIRRIRRSLAQHANPQDSPPRRYIATPLKEELGW